MKLFIGIDPGASGGVGFIDESGKAWAHKMPETDTDVLELLRSHPDYQKRAAIEHVHAMPSQGVTSTFKFGMNYGGLSMALLAESIPFDRISPATWQKQLQCLTGGDKNISKRRAQELFPTLKITHAIADALLIAEFARRMETKLK